MIGFTPGVGVARTEAKRRRLKSVCDFLIDIVDVNVNRIEWIARRKRRCRIRPDEQLES